MTVLVATLNVDNINQLIKDMNLESTETIVVHQSSQKRSSSQLVKRANKTVLYSDRIGLSASRNDAIALADVNAICQIADDDMMFVNEYDRIVEQAYHEFPDADFIIFYVDQENEQLSKKKLRKGKLNYLTVMKVSSVQINFRKSSFMSAHLQFDERFGIGAPYTSGEESILLFDALRSGLKIYSYPVKIATLRDRKSHWDRSNTPENCRKRGAVYKRMSSRWYWLLIIQFAIRKRKLMKPEISVMKNIKYMFQGAKDFEKGS